MAFPPVIEIDRTSDARTWIASHRGSIQDTVESYGAALVRWTQLSETAFKDVVRDLTANPLDYMYRSTPRTDLGGGVFTATEYPAGLDIPMHNENAYQRVWPLRLLFYCAQPADGGGGQTPLANMINVTERIAPAVRRRFLEKQVMYVRNFNSGIDLPWQTVFQTRSRADVEAYCRVHDIAFEWTGRDTLRTRQVCQAFATHPTRHVTVWFNQAHLFHPSALDAKTRAAMREMLREEQFPRNVTFGDGTPIAEADLANIREAFAHETVTFPWCAGDILFIDNMLVAHGRKAYRGHRRVLVAMFEPCSLDGVLSPVAQPQTIN
jgi:hypothetical protein